MKTDRLKTAARGRVAERPSDARSGGERPSEDCGAYPFQGAVSSHAGDAATPAAAASRTLVGWPLAEAAGKTGGEFDGRCKRCGEWMVRIIKTAWLCPECGVWAETAMPL